MDAVFFNLRDYLEVEGLATCPKRFISGEEPLYPLDRKRLSASTPEIEPLFSAHSACSLFTVPSELLNSWHSTIFLTSIVLLL